MFILAYPEDPEHIAYFDQYFNKYIARGGTLAWRINNPGLVPSHSHISKKCGSIGACGPYAIFASPEQGYHALSSWFQLKKYQNSTVKAVAKHYQPSYPEGFLLKLIESVEFPIKQKLKLFPQQIFQSLIKTISKLCNYAALGNEALSLLPKIICKIENNHEKEDLYLISDDATLSKEEAIQQVLMYRLDAVVVHEQNNKTHLRSRPSHCFRKIKINPKELPPSILQEEKIDTLVRIVGKKRNGQCIWGFINGIDNTKEMALASALLISQSSGGEQVLSMPNDTLGKVMDLGVCGILKVSINTPLVFWTVKFLRYLLTIAKLETNHPPVIIFAHSQGAIYIEHALELLNSQERTLLRIFTFGGGSYIPPGKSHPDSHNYASAADFVCRFGSPNLQCLALKRYYGLKNGLSERQVMQQLAYEDALLSLNSVDPKTIEIYTKSRENHYEREFSKISHITILDPDPGSDWKHEFGSECYQSTILAIIKKYQKQ